MGSAVERGVFQNAPASGLFPTDLLLGTRHCPSLGALKSSFPLPGCRRPCLAEHWGEGQQKEGPLLPLLPLLCPLCPEEGMWNLSPRRSLQEGAHSKSPPRAGPWAGLDPSVPVSSTEEGQQGKLGLGKASRQPRAQTLRRHSTSASCKGRAGAQEWGFLKHCTQGTSLASSSLVLALEERSFSTQSPHEALYPNSPNSKAETQQPAMGKVNSPFSMEGVS